MKAKAAMNNQDVVQFLRRCAHSANSVESPYTDILVNTLSVLAHQVERHEKVPLNDIPIRFTCPERGGWILLST